MMTNQLTIRRAFSMLLLMASPVLPAAATESPSVPIPSGVTRVLRGVPPGPISGGTISAPQDFMTDAERQVIREQIDASVERLRLAGKLGATAFTAHPLFGWPLRSAAGISDPGYYSIYYFVDQEPSFPNLLLDYNCGMRTYDSSNGYNHAGTDFVLWPWAWKKMDASEVEIVAVAPGQIVLRSDGNFDRNCTNGNNGDWNAVYVRHADGSIAWYGHMKNGSPTPKQVGDTVVKGEYLGTIGSSGNSSGPHLHLEIYNAANQLIDPWTGSCNALNPGDPWWESQRPYYDSAVDRLTTGDLPPDFSACPSDEIPHARVTFGVAPVLYVTAYYRDQLETQASVYTVYRPDATIYSQWTHSIPVSYLRSSSWTFPVSIPSSEMQGSWRFTVDYNSTTFERQFTIGSPAACGSVPETPAQGTTLKLQKISTSAKLTWGASCNPQDTDFVVYQGTIGAFASHAPVRCSTAGGLSAVLSPAGSVYFLVGPRNATREGSLGTMSDGTERPVGVSSCSGVTRLALQCP